MLKHLQPVLEILDEGIGLYRAAFSRFVLVAAIWIVPLMIALGLSIWLTRFLDDASFILLLLVWALLLVPLGIYIVGGLSRVALAMQQQRRLGLREALAIDPLRAAGMGCYGVIMLLVANMASSLFSMICICPMYIGLMFTVGGIFSIGDALGEAGAVIGVFLLLIFVLVAVFLYGLGLVISGAAYSTVVYGLQPFVHQDRPFASVLQESIDLVFYRFGRNLLVFMGTSLVFGALAITVTIAVSVLLPLPLVLALGEQSVLAQGVGASAWMLGLLLVVPLLPIWMALLYQRNVYDRDGQDLALRIAARYPGGERHQAAETEGVT